MRINDTQHQAQLQNWSQGLGLGFFILLLGVTLFMHQNTPDELLTLLFLLKVLMHLLSPVMCSALCNSQCSLNFLGKGDNLEFKLKKSNDLWRLHCI